MNIFVLDRDPKTAAYMMCDKHVVKMILESAQMLSAVLDHQYKKEYRGGDGSVIEQFGLPGYPKAHAKHPCTLWLKESQANFYFGFALYRGTIAFEVSQSENVW